MRFPLRRLFLLIFVAAAFLALNIAGPRLLNQAMVESFSGPTMGTAYQVSFVQGGVTHAGGSDALNREFVASELARVNSEMSTYDPGSELSRFNTSDSTEWFEVSMTTVKTVNYALELARDSDGAYDPTVGPIVNLWGFGPGKRQQKPPTDDEIATARRAVGYDLVEARLAPPALRKTNPNVYLDLSSIAKGHGADRVSELLSHGWAEASMVEIGGEIVCRGTKPDGSPWRIGIEKPDSTTGRLIQSVVELRDEAIATSGDYHNFFEVNGVRYSHTIDPKTGRPVTHNAAAVTVRAADCMTADALATTLLVMGPDAGYDWAEEREIAAMFLLRSEDMFAEKTTKAWRAKLQESP